MKLCYINQPVGIGDIFFTQKIAAHYVDTGYKVVWPVRPDLLWLNDYMISPGVLYVDPSTKIILNDKEISPDQHLNINLQSADQVYPNMSLLECKYKLADIDYKDWKYYFNFKRNIKKENELFYDILNLTDDEQYAFVNRYVGTPELNSDRAGSEDRHKVCPATKIKTVDLRLVAGYNVLDWCKVLEQSTEIYMIDTSFNYIAEKLHLKARTRKLYSRYTPADFSHIKNLWDVDWELMYT